MRPVGALPNITTRILGKAERTSKQPDLLPPTATPRLYQRYLRCAIPYEKKVGGHIKQCFVKTELRKPQAALTRLPPTRLGTVVREQAFTLLI